MKLILPLALLALSACTTMPTPSCATADRVRAAAALALQALERACPIDLETTP